MLTHMEEGPRRRALFMAFVPLWQALNADDGPSSPYRRMVRMAAREARKKGSPVDAAARTIGISKAESERWLVRILDAWRQVSGTAEVEPWDYRFACGAAVRGSTPRTGAARRSALFGHAKRLVSAALQLVGAQHAPRPLAVAVILTQWNPNQTR
jgi:hypothetical protein